MLIPFKDVLERHGLRPLLVTHVGAHYGEEMDDYLAAGVQGIIFVEAMPHAVEHLRRTVAARGLQRVLVLEGCIAEATGRMVDFYMTNNGQSSSFLNLGLHRQIHPEVVVTKTVPMRTITLVDLFTAHQKEISSLSNGANDEAFLNIDVQGAELKVLMGIANELRRFRCIYIEVNAVPVYDNCPLIESIDEYLSGFGFVRKETKWSGYTLSGGQVTWGDAVYIKDG